MEASGYLSDVSQRIQSLSLELAEAEQRFRETIQSFQNEEERLLQVFDSLSPELREKIEENPEELFNVEELREIIYEDSLEDFLEENPKKEEVSHSPYFMQKFEETIQSLPPELREKIYKDYVSMMQKERAVMGWEKVHEVLLQAAKDPNSTCKKCMNRRFGGCTFCREVSRLRWNGLLKTSNYYDEMID